MFMSSKKKIFDMAYAIQFILLPGNKRFMISNFYDNRLRFIYIELVLNIFQW